METVHGDILVLPFFGQGHLFPCIELCKRLSSYNYKLILIIPSHLSSSIPSSLNQNHSLVEVLEVPASYSPLPPPPELRSSPPPPPPIVSEQEVSAHGPGNGHGSRPNHHHHQELGKGIESFINDRYKNTGRIRPLCVVMDVMMSWSKELFKKMEIPVVSFFTSGACSAAVEYAAWKAHIDDVKPGETRVLPGLPESMALSYSDLKRKGRPPSQFPKSGPVGPPSGMNFGPPGPGQPPIWLEEADGSTALLINTCDDLEQPFLEYISIQIRKTVLGVGPLLPDKYWKSVESNSILHDSRSDRKSNYTEDKVVQWLDSKPSQSVIYVSFGSEVGPTLEEYAELAEALGELSRPFIWVIQPGSGRQGPPPGFFGGKPGSDKDEGYYPYGLKEKVGDRGLIIKGWAPQLLILSHPSTGGFLSHCGWNSTVEAIGFGVPILAWPIRGDQFYDAKLVMSHLKVGHMVSRKGDFSEMIKKDDIMQQIEKLMGDEEVHNRAMGFRHIFGNGYPSTSMASLKAFLDLISQ
ncbi:UDP-glycosyltransferase 73B4-like [Olea europaea subsp. europaea]|uniref:Glycosyltransferase n=1 Tax=Olea europaea subsp. europaea TaxID=158383 RepID=A0A8S0SFF5_OLEEU|nr:UDP-glycosyltransferase 73B4-like [Olea europaea subsp. europaea]